jgi:hypothetical protein
MVVAVSFMLFAPPTRRRWEDHGKIWNGLPRPPLAAMTAAIHVIPVVYKERPLLVAAAVRRWPTAQQRWKPVLEQIAKNP